MSGRSVLGASTLVCILKMISFTNTKYRESLDMIPGHGIRAQKGLSRHKTWKLPVARILPSKLISVSTGDFLCKPLNFIVRDIFIVRSLFKQLFAGRGSWNHIHQKLNP